MAGRHVVHFWYDVTSPFSYIAFRILQRYRSVWSLDVVFRPVFLGGVLIASSNRPPMATPNKGAHNLMEMPHLAKFYNVDMTIPKHFPVQTLYAIRVLRLIQDQDPARLEEITEAFFKANFVDGVPDWSPNGLASILSPAHYSQSEAEKLLKAANEPEIKDKVKAEAVQLSEKLCFGVPWMQVQKAGTEETCNIFGSDRFEFLAWFLGEKWYGPTPPTGPSSKL